MTLYRVLKPLSTGHQPGQLVNGESFKQLKALVENRALAKVLTPPLSELPGWKLRSEKLARIGVTTIQDFLDVDNERLKRLFNYKTLRMINKWKEEVQDWLTIEDEPPKKKK